MKNFYKNIYKALALLVVCSNFILAQSITITAPIATDRWEAGTIKQIAWIPVGVTGNVDVQYSTNGGGAWNTITTVSATDGVYDWSIPAGIGSSNMVVRVRETSNPFTTGTSSAFLIGRLTLTAPAAGSKFMVGQTVTITWTENPTALSSNLDYSTDGGTTWNAITTNVAGTSYTWTVPNTPSNNCKIRIRDYNGPADPNPIIDDFTSTFTIAKVTVIGPNGGATLKVGQTSIISWSSAQISLVNIDYSTNSGSTWINIVSNFDASLGSYSWVVPNNPSSFVLVRVTDATTATITDQSDAVNKIVQLSLSNPMGGEHFQTGNVEPIQWTASSNITSVNIYYTTDGGVTKTSIQAGVASNAGSNTYNWTIGAGVPRTDNLRIFIEDNTGSVTDITPATFSVSNIIVIDPNGGESLFSGNIFTIRWQSENISKARLEYSTNGGATYTLISSGVTSNDGVNTYDWTIPTVPSEFYRVRVSDDDYPLDVLDASNANFTVVSVNLTYPNGGGLTFHINSTVNITWVKAAGVAAVTLEYTTDNGASWINISGSETGTSYAWVVPSSITPLPATQCRIRVFDNSNATITDQSDNQFTITAIRIGNLPGSIQANRPYNLTWTNIGPISRVKLEYSTDNGSTWSTITGADDLAASDLSYTWNVPNISAANCLVRVSDKNDPNVKDVCDATFAIRQLEVTAPNGGENWTAGATKSITWFSNGVTSVDIHYSTNGGGSWTLVQGNTASSGSYTWNIPTSVTSSATCQIRIRDYNNNSIYDIVDANFTLSKLTFVSPAGGEGWQIGSAHNVSWTAENIPNNVQLAYSTDGGTVWTNFPGPSLNPTSGTPYLWTIPNVPSENVRLRLADVVDPTRSVVSQVFTIASLDLTTPTSADNILNGQTFNINWTSSGFANIQLHLSTDDGATWPITIVNSTPASAGTYPWTVSVGATSTNCRIRARDLLTNQIVDISDRFTISSLTLSQPTGTSIWMAGTTQNITWTSNNLGNLKIEYSSDNGLTWPDVIVASTANDGQYEWAIPSNYSATNARIRISDVTDANKNVVSPAFRIGWLNFTSAIDGQNWQANTNQTITWTASASLTGQNVRLQYRINGGAWTNIAASVLAESGSYTWTVVDNPSTAAEIRITYPTSGTNIYDQSATFTISRLAITAPNVANLGWAIGKTYNITWQGDNAGANVKLELSTDNGVTWPAPLVITASTPNTGSYSWTVPAGVSTTQGRIRISNSDVPPKTDVNDYALKIGSLSITAPTAASRWKVGNVYPISWSASSSLTNVKLDYSTDGGTTWTNFVPSVSASSGTYNWTVTATPSDICKIRISDVTAGSDIIAESPTFVINNITVTYPNTAISWKASSSQSITWVSPFVDYVDIKYAADGTNFSTTVASNIAAGSGSYTWNPIPAITTPNGKIRVYDHADNAIYDESDVTFKIADVAVTAPNGYESIQAGKPYNITWTSAEITNVKIEFSTDGGTNYTTVVASTPAGTGSYTWTPSTATTQGIIRISDAAFSNVSDVSNNPFTVKNLTLSAPNGGEKWQSGVTKNITWSASGVSLIDIYYADNVNNYVKIADNVNAASGSYAWTVPATTTKGRIKIEEDGVPAVYDESDANFTITSIVVNSPNAGTEIWNVGGSATITWTATNISNIKIDLSTTGGEPYSIPVVASTPNDGSHTWVGIPASAKSVNAKIKISDADAVTDISSDASDNSFNIVVLSLTSPNTAVTWVAGKSYAVTWDQELLSGTVDIFYAPDGLSYTLIGDDITASLGTWTWNIPALQTPTTSAKIKIVSNSDVNIYDESATAFTVAALTLSTPNGGDKLQVGNNYNITWTSSNLPFVRLDYSTDNGSTWNLIQDNLPASPASYTWTSIPAGAVSSTARIRISDAADAANSYYNNDRSDNSFFVKSLAIIDPAAGVNLKAGGTTTIRWTKSSNVSSVAIYYAADGTNYSATPVATGLTGLTYVWTVPVSATSTARIKVVDETHNEILAISQPFTITTLSITSPVGGEILSGGRTLNITWTGLTPVRIDYSSDGGSNWSNIVTSASGSSYAWTIPAISGSFPSGTNYKIRVGDPVNYTTFNDVSSSFTIKKIRVSSPTTGTEVWLAGKTYNITWDQELVSGTVDIEYAEDGVTYSTLFSGISASLGSQAWAIPAAQTPTTNARIRIKDNASPSTVYDESDASFTIATLKLLTPNGSEVLQTGNTYTVTWESQNLSNVGLYYTTDNGTSWTLIINNLPATPASYNWSIPDAAVSDQARIRISDAADGSYFRSDISDNTFIVKKLAVTAPLAGANLRANGTANITWTKSSNVASVKIQYAQNGTTFSDIVGATGITGTSYTWTVPSATTTTGKVRIIDEVTSQILATSGAFNITTLALTYPVGGEKLQAERTVNITWTGLTPARIDYSKDGGTTWTNLVTSASGNSYAWTLPAISGSFPAGTNYKVRVGDPVSYATFNDVSASFTVKGLTLTSPTLGSEVWLTGKTYNITWSQSLVTGTVDIDYAPDGVTYSNIASGISGTLGTWAWSVPTGLTATTAAKVRIKDNDSPSTIYDESDNVFTIAKLSVTAPNAGTERLQTGKNYNISWTSQNIANVRIDYTTDNGSTWVMIVDNLNASTGLYTWSNIPTAAVTDQAKIRVSDASDNPTYARNDISDNTFSIKQLNVTNPLAGVNLKAGASYNITWNKSSNVSSVKILYASDGTTFTQITGATGLTGSSYTWTVPTTTTTTGKVRVVDETDNVIIGESGAFNITDLTLTYPVGGEKLQAGTTKNITWTGLATVKIEYSTNGVTWTLITSGATGGSYAWSIPAGITAASTYLIRVSDPLDVNFNSISLPFTINKLTVTSPNTGSEVWMAGKSYNITWTAELVGTVDIEYAQDGITFSALSGATGLNSALGTWTWNIPAAQAVTTTGKIRIVENGAGTSTKDESDAAFKIAKLQLATPNGGEIYQVGKAYAITWSSQNITNVKLEYSTDDGTTWSSIIASTPAAAGTYSWTVPLAAVSTQARVRVIDASDVTNIRSDASDAVFTVSRLDVVSPNGGESWQTGGTYKIKWNSSNVTSVKIEYSSDNGSTWSEISASTAASLGATGYDWVVPTSAGTNQNLIRLTDVSNPSIQDVSNSYFYISTLALVSPVGGEKWQAGSTHAIQWTSSGITNVKLEYTLDGSTWGIITSSTPAATGTYNWTLPSDTSSTMARVRITDVADATAQKVSDNTFTVAKLRVTQPNGGENWQIGTIKQIKWVSANVSLIDIKFAADGVNFTTDIATNINTSSGSYNWTIAQAATQNAKIRIVESGNATILDESDNVFQLNSLVLTQPNGGEKWQAGRTKTITWTNSSGISNVRLEYSSNGGVSYVTGSPITASTPTGATGGSYTWTIPAGITSAATYLVRVIDVANTTTMDASNATFEIRKLQLTEPIGPEIYQAGSSQKIKWTSENVTDVKIFYSSDNGVSWPVQLTAPTTPASGGSTGFSWTAPTNTGTQHRIKIVDSQTDSVYWISDNPFQIAQLTLTSPTAGTENWLSGSTRQITWNSSGISNVKLEYTLDGVLWNTITNSAVAATGTYNWTLPADTSTTTARVRVSVVGNAAIYSQSANEFTISRLKILNPNGGENLLAGGSYTIKWSSKNITDVNLYYASDGVTWGAPFASNVGASSGQYVWTVPTAATNTGKIKIASSADPSNIYVISAGSFSISKLDLTSPNGGEKWQAGKNYDIKWTQTGLTTVKLEYSTNGGVTFTQIASGIAGSTGSYTWTIPVAAVSNSAKIRISDETNSAITDVSTAIFTIYNLDLVSPNGAEIWQRGSNQNITWTSSYVNNVRIWYSSDNGSTWTTIVASVSAATGSYTWNVDKSPSNLNKIKISDADNPTIADSSANPFIISELALTAPTGTDNWQAGTTQNITWTSNGIANVKLEYSTDNGLSWSDIVTNALASDGTYAWTIPSGIYTTEALIRITNIANPLIFNVSDQFTIKRIKLTSPVGGEYWNANTTKNITWESGAITSVNIEYSTNGTFPGTTIATGVATTDGANSYSWLIPSGLASNVKIRITDASYSQIKDQSANTFKVGMVSVTSPNGGENWQAGTSKTITFSKSSNITNVNIDYTTNNGLDWTNIVTGHTAAAGAYTWNIPLALASTDIKVRVSDAVSSNQIADISDASFVISKLQLSLPNGNEQWQAGTTKRIEWTRSSNINNVKLEYTTDGVSWNTITASTAAATLYYDWDIPAGASSSQAKVRIKYVTDTTIADVSDNVFTIGWLQLTAPNLSSAWQAGKTYAIQWTASSSMQYVKLEYSTDAGGTWNMISNSINASLSTYNWLIPDGISSSQCLIRISDAATSGIQDISDQFVISHILLISPNGGQVLSAGNNQVISWTSGTVISQVKLEYSSNDGSTWILIADNIPAYPTSYNWVVPGTAPASDKYRIKISDSFNSNIYDISDATFTVSNLKLTAPNGGEYWQARKTYQITWNSSYITDVKLEYSLNNGTSWNDIIVSTPAAPQSYNWTIPDGTVSNQAKIRISNVSNPSTLDVSDNTFTISDLRLTSPAGTESWQVNSTHSITWTSSNVGNVNIVYAADGVNFINTIATGISASLGTYAWTTPATTTPNGRIKIFETTRPTVSDSSAAFEITSLTVVSPNGGQQWQSGKTYPITWTQNYVNNVKIEYSTNGTNWYLITPSTPGSALTYNWTIPDDTTSSNVKIRISDADYTTTYDVSDNPFTISKLKLVTPDGGNYWQAGISEQIQWQAGNIANVKIEYSTDNGSTWSAVTASVSGALGSFNWAIPAATSTSQARVRVTDASNSAIRDSSSAAFKIGWVKLLQPNAGENWQEGKSYNITWQNSGSVSNIKLEYSTDNGGTWNEITASTPASAGSWPWTVPANIASNISKIRISDAPSGLGIVDESDVVFTISKLKILSPNGGETLQSGVANAITWSRSSDILNVKLEYTTDNGTNWNVITNSVSATSGAYNWTTPTGISSSQCNLRISNVTDNTVNDVCDSLFTISNLRVLSPNGAETWLAGTNKSITWTIDSGIPNVKIDYSTNNGGSWVTIVASTANSGSYNWLVPSTISSTNCKIRISHATKPAIYDASDNIFVIGNLTLTSPIGGENWQALTTKNITWTEGGAVANVKIEYSTNNGGSWTTLIASTPSTGSYAWTLPDVSSTQCMVIVSDASRPAIADTSSLFTIKNLKLLTPVTGEYVQANKTYNITWSNSSSVSNLKIEFSTDAGGNWTTLDPSYPAASGTYSWSIGNINTIEGIVKITDVADPTVHEQSGAFTIAALSVTSPVGGEHWQDGTIKQIKWSSQRVSNVNILYAEDGVTFTTVASNISAALGTYNWTVPVNATTTGKIRVEDAAHTHINSVSAAFTISNLDMTSPIGGEYWQSGTTKNVTWTSANVVTVNIDYYNGSAWSPIATGISAAAGTYAWAIPSVSSSALSRVRVSDAAYATIKDSSATAFKTGWVNITTPSSPLNWQAGTTQNIVWTNSTSISNVRIDYSSDNGLSWNVLTLSTPTTSTGGSYAWIIPDTLASTNALIRVSDAPSSLAIQDISDASFVLSNLRLVTPLGGQYWQAGTTKDITWTSSGDISSVRLEYSTNNGVNWLSIINSTPAGSGTYSWLIPVGTSTTQARVRISDVASTTTKDSSHTKFNIGWITVTNPAGGVNWQVDSIKTITWTASSSVNNVKIEYSTNNGTSWNVAANSVAASMGSYAWTVPNFPTTQARIRISDAASSGNISSLNPAVFTISYLKLTSPIGGENWLSSSVKAIKWSASANINNVIIELSTDNGSNWTNITTTTAASGQYNWTIPANMNENFCKIRVKDALNSNIISISGLFSIYYPYLELISPLGGEIWQAGKQYDIKFSTGNFSLINKVNIYISLDDGNNYTLIKDSVTTVQNENIYKWTIPNNTSSTQARVKIVDADNPTVAVFSPNTFVIKALRLITPNGGENWPTGTSQVITWESGSSVNNIKLEYTTNNGSTWIQINPNILASQNSYTWLIPDNVSSTSCKVRVTDVAQTIITDASDSVFTISAIHLKAPNGGEAWIAGTYNTVEWESGSAITNVAIDYSTDNGANWKPVAASVTGSLGKYDWYIDETISSTQCRVRVRNAADPNIYDVSDDVFSIFGLKILSPAGGEEWQAGTKKSIVWTSGNIANVRLQYSTDNGKNWQIIVNSVPASSGLYEWTLPQVYSDSCRVRISDVTRPTLGVNSNLFTIYYPSVVLNSPNGGESWQTGKTYNINWTSNRVSNVKLEYSTNNGLDWLLIYASVPANLGTYTWLIPYGKSSTQAKIRITDVDNATVFDESNVVFTINELRLLTPNGGENWQEGNTYPIQWESSANIVDIRIEYRAAESGAWVPIVSSVGAATKTYNWQVPNNIVSTECRIRIVNISDPTLKDSSDNVFTIGKLQLVSPNGGEKWQAGSTKQIQWSSGMNMQYVKLEYTLNGVNWVSIPGAETYTASIGSFNWKIPANIHSTTAKVRVSDASNSNIFDVSDSVFTISSLNATSPNGGEHWPAGVSKTITWTSYHTNTVNLEYSINKGTTWNSIASNVSAALGVYTWNIPVNTSTSEALVRITDAENIEIKDTSDNTFSIGWVQVLSPNGGDAWLAGSSRDIKWSNSPSVTNVKIEYKTDNSSTWKLIVNSAPAASGLYAWTLPDNIASTNVIVRISDASYPEIFDTSDAKFTVSNLQITTPTAGALWEVNTNQTIYWTSSSDINYVKLEYSLNNGQTWLPIIGSVAASQSQLNWLVPSDAVSNECKIKITNLSNPLIMDTSEVFIIYNQDMMVVKPNGGEVWRVGNIHDITWEGGYIFNLKIEISTNGGAAWNTIVSSIPGSRGKYSWEVGNYISSNCYIRISNANNSTKYDISDNPFTICKIDLTNPNDKLSWQAGSKQYITWSSSQVDSVLLFFSSNNGENWQTIGTTAADSGRYLWTVPSIYSRECKIRVAHKNYPDIYDQSDSVFAIASYPKVTAYRTYQSKVAKFIYRVNTTETLNITGLQFSTDDGDNWSNGALMDTYINITGNVSDTIRWNTSTDLADFENKLKVKVIFTSNFKFDYEVVLDSVGIDNLAPRFTSSNVTKYQDPFSLGWDKFVMKWNAATDVNTPIKYVLYANPVGDTTKKTVSNVSSMDSLIISSLTTSTEYDLVLEVSDVFGNKTTYVDGYKTTALCDFNKDNTVSAPDLGGMLQAYTYKEKSKAADIDPYTGSLPYTLVKGDGKLNSEDLLLFVQMWNYSLDNGNLPKKGEIDFTTGNVSRKEIRFKTGENAFSLPIDFGQSKDVMAVSVLAQYDPAAFEFDSVKFAKINNNNGLALVSNDSINGRLIIDFADISDMDNVNYALNSSIKCKFDRLEKKDSLTVLVKAYNSQMEQTLEQKYIYAFTEVPATYKLYQNYPNPFNPRTTIEYDLPQDSKVTLILYDILGREVAVLVNEIQKEGTHRTFVNAASIRGGLSSGVYFYRIHAGDFVTTKKMLLIK